MAKAARRSLTDKAIFKLEPYQLGLGIHLGAEVVVRAAARVFLENLKSGQALLTVDFLNAFNTLRRDCMLSTVRRDLPELYDFLNSCYSNPSFLRFGQYILSSDKGGSKETHDVRCFSMQL